VPSEVLTLAAREEPHDAESIYWHLVDKDTAEVDLIVHYNRLRSL